MGRSRIVATIRKCLDRAARTTYAGEAMISRRMAVKLMRQHNVSIEEIDFEKSISDVLYTVDGKTEFYKQCFFTIIAQLTGCRCVIKRVLGVEGSNLDVRVIGTIDAYVRFKYVYDHLFLQFKNAFRLASFVVSDFNSFVVGMVDGLVSQPICFELAEKYGDYTLVDEYIKYKYSQDTNARPAADSNKETGGDKEDVERDGESKGESEGSGNKFELDTVSYTTGQQMSSHVRVLDFGICIPNLS